MSNRFLSFFKNKRLIKWSIIGLTTVLGTSAIVLPTVFYGTTPSSKLLFIDSLGKVRLNDENTNTEKVYNEFMGPFEEGTAYKKGEIVQVEEVKFHNENLIDEVATVNNIKMYEFTEDYAGGTFEDAPVVEFNPENLSTISLPLYQFINDSREIDKMMGHSIKLKQFGRSSITGKFNGTGDPYLSGNTPGLASVNDNDLYVKLTGLDNYFTWTNTHYEPLLWYSPEQTNTNLESPKYKYDPGSTTAINAYPERGDSPEEKFADRYSYKNVGMYAIQLNNESGEAVDSWYSSINGQDYARYISLQTSYTAQYFSDSGNLGFSSLSNDSEKTFFLDDDNLGVYLYSKVAVAPTSDRGASSSSNGLVNSASAGYYYGTGEPIISYASDDKGLRYLGGGSEIVSIKTPSGTISRNISGDALKGVYIYSRTGKAFLHPGPASADFLAANSLINVDQDYTLPDGQVIEVGSKIASPTFPSDPFNVERSISYYNGVFSINKPSYALTDGETQTIDWYVPLASTNYKLETYPDKIEEYNDTLLASDAAGLNYISNMIDISFFNAIPSTIYGANITITPDNTTGTIWVNIKSGPTVDVVNGCLYKTPVLSSTVFSRPEWLVGQSWYYWNKGVNSSYWRNNENNPVSEVDIGDPIDITIPITGFTKIRPTAITNTTSTTAGQFEPGISIPGPEIYGAYRLTSQQYTSITPFEYIKRQEELPISEQYSDLIQMIYEELIYNLPTIRQPNGKAFVQLEDLVKTSDAVAFNFVDENNPSWGGRLQFSVTLKSYFDDNGMYVSGSGGFPSVPVVFGGFKAVPGPTTINANYNLNANIPGGAVAFNKQNMGGNGVNYPSDYLSEGYAPAGSTVYEELARMIYKWSQPDPFLGDAVDSNQSFTPSNYMIKNLPDLDDDGNLPFSILPENVQYNNFSGVLKITPTFNRYYSTDGTLISGVATTLGTITISGFQTVNGPTYIPAIVNAISTKLQPSAIVTTINGVQQVDAAGNYIGQELYKIAWNDTINLPTRNEELPNYGVEELTDDQLNEIKQVIDIKVKPDDPTWVNNIDGTLKFAVAFKKMFNSDGVPIQILDNQLWPENWENGGTDDDNVFIVEAIGYTNSPGPTGILQQDGANRNIVVNQPSYQPAEFIKNDANAGYPLLSSIIAGNLVNLPIDFNPQNIVLDVDQFSADNEIDWEPEFGQPLTPNNRDGTITVQVYLTQWYDDNAKLCNYIEDNDGLPYSKDTWSFTISGFMTTPYTNASDLEINDTNYITNATDDSDAKYTIDLNNDYITSTYPEIGALKGKFPYEVANTSTIRELIMIKNATYNPSNGPSANNQPYLLMKNIPTNIKPYSIVVSAENIVVNNLEGSVEFKIVLRQWYAAGAEYHPVIGDEQTEYLTPHAIKITGLKNVGNATVINPDGDTIDSSNGTITLTNTSTSTNIIKGILMGKSDENFEQYKNLDISIEQPTILNELDYKAYIYVALVESNGSPYTLAPGSMVEEVKKTDADGTTYSTYIINDAEALNQFITWKNTPEMNLREGEVTLTPMLNLWFGGDDVQIFKQYATFGAGENGKPNVSVNSNGEVTVNSATVQVVKLSGFIQANDGELTFNGNAVYNGTVITTLNGVNTSDSTASSFYNSGQLIANVNEITVLGGVVAVWNEETGQFDTVTEADKNINNLVDLSDPSSFKVNELNGTIEIITKNLKYFDAGLNLVEGRISIVLSGFKPSAEAYNTTYIVLIITVIALIIILAIVLGRILWVRYSRTRNEYNNQ